MSAALRSVAELRERYRQAREARGWSQTRAAEAAGVGRHTVERFESGTGMPLVDTTLKMLAAVGLDLVLCEREAARRSA